jgi:ribonuclease D
MTAREKANCRNSPPRVPVSDGLCTSCKQYSKSILEPSWVAAQALDIRRRELEAEEQAYEQRLAKARKTEAQLRMLARARVIKKQVRVQNIRGGLIGLLSQ